MKGKTPFYDNLDDAIRKSDSEAALKLSLEGLQAVRERWPRVLEVTNRLKEAWNGADVQGLLAQNRSESREENTKAD